METNIPLSEHELGFVLPYVVQGMLLAFTEETLDAESLHVRTKKIGYELAVTANIEIKPDNEAVRRAFSSLIQNNLIGWFATRSGDSAFTLTDTGKQRAEELGQARA